MIINQLQRVGAILKNKLTKDFISTCIGFTNALIFFFILFYFALFIIH